MLKSGELSRQRRKLARTSTLTVVPPNQKHDNSAACRASKASKSEKAVQAVTALIDVACETVTVPPEVPKRTLSTEKVATVSIPPRKVYHPAIINASKAFYDKHPSELSQEEKEKFKFYIQHKRSCGEPVETDIIYLPSSMRNRLHCGHPT